MGAQVAVVNGHAAAQPPALLSSLMESVLLVGDLSKLEPQQRVECYAPYAPRSA